MVLTSVLFRPLSDTSCNGRSLDDLEDELATLCTDDYLVPKLKRAIKDHARDRTGTLEEWSTS